MRRNERHQRTGIMQRGAVQPMHPAQRRQEEIQQIGDNPRHPPALAQPLDIRRRRPHPPRHIKPHHPERHAAAQHDVGRLRIAEDIELRHLADIADPGGAAHDADARQPLAQLRLHRKRQPEIGQRPGRHQHQRPAMRPRGAQDQLDGMHVLGRPVRLRQFSTINAALAMDRPAMDRRRHHRHRRAGRHRNIERHQPAQAQRVARGQLQRLIAIDRGDCPQVEMLGGIDHRDGIVVARIAIEQDRRGHRHSSFNRRCDCGVQPSNRSAFDRLCSRPASSPAMNTASNRPCPTAVASMAAR